MENSYMNILTFSADNMDSFWMAIIGIVVLLWILDTLRKYMQRIRYMTRQLIDFASLGGTMYGSTYLDIEAWQPASDEAMWIRNAIVILLGYGQHQWILQRFIPRFGFLRGEAVKFLTLVGGLLALFGVGNVVGYSIDSSKFGAVVTNDLSDGVYIAIALIVAFAMGNLLNNVRRIRFRL